MSIRWPWKPRHVGPPDESTQDRRNIIATQQGKLRRAETLAARLKAEDRINHYAQRLRRSAAAAAAQEGSP